MRVAPPRVTQRIGDADATDASLWLNLVIPDAASVAAFLVDRGELATELRQSSPFAGAITPQERWRIWSETRERFAAER